MKIEVVNRLRTMFARALIIMIHYPYRGFGRLRGRSSPVIEHYLIPSLLKLGGSRYPVTLKYPNPISTGNNIIKLNLDLCRTSQFVYFRRRGQHEIGWISLVALAMEKNETFIDVGAHIGVYSVTIAQAFPHQRIVAIEPLFSNYSRLEDNIRAHGLSNVEAIQGAVTMDNGSVRFYENPLNDGGGSILEPTEYRTGDVAVDAATYRVKHPEFDAIHDVSSLALDDVITSHSVIKIDVEGAEALVLRSGMKSLKSGLVDLMVVEVIKDSVGEVIDLADEAEFDCFMYGRRHPLTRAEDFIGPLDNILCLRRRSPMYDVVMSKFGVETGQVGQALRGS